MLTAILALDRDHHAFLVRVLDRCVAMTTEYIESNGGLYEVLTADEMLEGDVAGDREDRRAETGHVPPTDAAAFLKLAKTGSEVAPTEHDPLTRAYFRRLVKAAAPAGRVSRDRPAAMLDGPSQAIARLPASTGAGAAPAEPLLIRAMRQLAEDDPARFGERTEELAYLVNVLVAGCSFRGRRLRPMEATAAVIATCSEGLALALGERGAHEPPAATTAASAALREHPADGLFRLAWRQIDTDRVLALACSGKTGPRGA